MNAYSLSYESTKQNPSYTEAKELLQVGDFEAALATIEGEISTTISLLSSLITSSSSSSNTKDLYSSNVDLHEALAPLYYLYGTTLLYSVEESQNPEESVMMNTSTTSTNNHENDDDNNDGDNQDEMGGAVSTNEEITSDLQIAWENLETARSIIVRLLESSALPQEASNLKQDDRSESLKNQERLRIMDLAQIHCRLADLSRHNGHYQRAVKDYEECCELRKKCSTPTGADSNSDLVFDRKMADVEYNLGMTCLLYAAEAEKILNSNTNNEANTLNDDVASSAMAKKVAAAVSADSENDDEMKLSLDQITTLREKSMYHYLTCGRILAGLIAQLCGENPLTFGEVSDELRKNLNNYQNVFDDSKKPAATSNDSELKVPIQSRISNALVDLYQRVQNLHPIDKEDQTTVDELCEILQEIQETVDTCENDREGLKDVSAMRKKAEEEIARGDLDNEAEKDSMSSPFAASANGGVTTIGFGGLSSASTSLGNNLGSNTISTSNVNGTGSQVTNLTSLVKKKKKRDSDQHDESQGKDKQIKSAE